MALWTPANASTPKVMWFDAADSSTLTLNGSGILNWADKSGTGVDAYQTNTTLQPQLIENALNGKPVVATSNTRWLQFASTRNLMDKTFIMLYDHTEGQNSSVMGDGAQRYQVYTKLNIFAFGYPLANPTSIFTLGTGWNIGHIGTHPTLEYYGNGIKDTISQTKAPGGNIPFSRLFWTGAGIWGGRAAEILMFDGTLSEDDRQRIEGYLAHKWGITSLLIPGHPYYNTAPVTEIVVPVSIPNAPDGARYRIWNSTRGAEIENALVSGTGGISTTFIADDDSVPHIENDDVVVDITYPVSTTAYLPSRVLGKVTQAGVSGFVAPIDDVIYNANGRNGSQEIGFVADFEQDDIDFSIFQDFYGTAIYAFYIHTLHSEPGIREWLGGITAIDQANYRVNVDIMRIRIDNKTDKTVVQLDNVRFFNSDGSRPVRRPCTGNENGIGDVDINWRSQVYTSVVTVSGSSVITGDISTVLAAVGTPMQAGALVDADVKRVNGVVLQGAGVAGNSFRPTD
jgi:hypothetical protein